MERIILKGECDKPITAEILYDYFKSYKTIPAITYVNSLVTTDLLDEFVRIAATDDAIVFAIKMYIACIKEKWLNDENGLLNKTKISYEDIMHYTEFDEYEEKLISLATDKTYVLNKLDDGSLFLGALYSNNLKDLAMEDYLSKNYKHFDLACLYESDYYVRVSLKRDIILNYMKELEILETDEEREQLHHKYPYNLI